MILLKQHRGFGVLDRDWARVVGGDALEDLGTDSEEIRGLREGAMYDSAIPGEAERRLAVTWISRTLPLIRAALVKANSALDSRLSKREWRSVTDLRARVEIQAQAWSLRGGQRVANDANALAKNAVSAASGVPM